MVVRFIWQVPISPAPITRTWLELNILNLHYYSRCAADYCQHWSLGLLAFSRTNVSIALLVSYACPSECRLVEYHSVRQMASAIEGGALGARPCSAFLSCARIVFIIPCGK